MLFVLPTAYPLRWATFNYTIVAVAVVLGAAALWWVAGARTWFTGPHRNLDGSAPAEVAR